MNLTQLIQANWVIFAIALVVVILTAVWLIGRATRSKPRERRPDVLDEGAAPAQRNQALIDAPPAAAVMPIPIIPSPAGSSFAGVAEVVAFEAERQAEVAQPKRAEVEQVQPEPAQPEAAPAIAPQTTAPVGAGEADDLRRIKGVGPKLVATLHALGVTRYSQIAGWSDADLDTIDAQLGAFAGRPRRDNWVEQARLLASGDTGAYEAKFGKL